MSSTAELICKAIATNDVQRLHDILNSKQLDCHIDTLIEDNSLTPLHLAIEHQHVDQARLLFEKGANPNSKNQDGDSCLHSAIKFDMFELIKLLLRRGNVNVANNFKRTLLHVAVETMNIRIVEALLNSGADINAQDAFGVTPLREATKHGFGRIMTMLLDKGADPNIPDNEGNTAFHASFNSSDRAVAPSFIAHGTNLELKDSDGMNALHLAIISHRFDLIKEFIKEGVNVNETTNLKDTPLHLIVKFYGWHADHMFRIISREPSLQPNGGKKALHAFVSGGALTLRKMFVEKNLRFPSCYTEQLLGVIDSMIERGADVNALDRCDKTPLDYIVDDYNDMSLHDIRKYNLGKAIGCFLSRNARISCGSQRMNVSEAIRNRDVQWIKSLVDFTHRKVYVSGIPSTSIPHEGEASPVKALCNVDKNFRFIALKFLLENGEDANARHSRGCTMLHLSLQMNDFAAFKLLMEHGADIEATTLDLCETEGLEHFFGAALLVDVNDEPEYRHNTLLVWAIKKKNRDIIRLLLESGANTNDPRVWEAIGRFGDGDMMELIEAHGGIYDPKSENGRCLVKTVLRERRRSDFLMYLLIRGADINFVYNGKVLLEWLIEENYNAIERHGLNSRYIESIQMMFKTLIKRTALLGSEDLFVDERNLRAIEAKPPLSSFYEHCGRELPEMRATRIGKGTDLAYIDFVAKCTNSLARCLRPKRVREIIESDDFPIFKLYRDEIQNNCSKALALLKKMNEFERVLQGLFEFVLPDCVIRDISEYYNDRDFKVCIQK